MERTGDTLSPSQPSQSHQLAAIMFTDIVGYTTLMDEDEDKAFELLEENRSIQKPIIEKFNGTWLKEMGDGILASFRTISEAVYCAREIIEEAMKNPDLSLRIGIHQGEVIVKDGDIFGSGVNIASRIEELAGRNSIWISEPVYRNIANRRDIETEFVGKEHLRHVKEPIKIYEVKVTSPVDPDQVTSLQSSKGLRWYHHKTTWLFLGLLLLFFILYLFTQPAPEVPSELPAEAVSPKSIAVLPFNDDSKGGDNQYFCDGMMDEILSHLQKITDLNVRSRTSVEQYRSTIKDMATIGRELKVPFVLEGAVRKYGDRFRITVQLIETETDKHWWSESYDGVYSDTIFVVQAHIARQIASSLNAVITPEEKERIERVPTSDINAYDFLIRGRHELQKYWRTYDDNHLKAADDLFNSAMEIDSYLLDAVEGKCGVLFARRNFDSALIYADKLIALDPEFVPGHGLKAECYFFMGRNDLAIENYLKAVSLTPKDKVSWYHVALGRAYSIQKEGVIKGLQYLEKGLELSTESLPTVYFNIGFSLTNIGDYKKAEEYYRKSLELDVGCLGIQYYSLTLAVQSKYRKALHFLDSVCGEQICKEFCHSSKLSVHVALKEFEQAEETLNLYLEDRGVLSSFDSINLAYMYKELGREEEALTILNSSQNSLERQLAENKTSGRLLILCMVHAVQEEKVKALEYLSEAVELGLLFGWHDYLEIHPIFENLRDDPEFKAIVKQAQEEKAGIRAQVREMEERGELDL